MMIIDIRNIPEDEHLTIEGELTDDICQLPENDPANVTSPLTYRAEASIISENLLLRGDFNLTFELTCCRCNQAFRHTVSLSGHSLLAPVGNLTLIDLTDALREDIILALPDFPHCNNGDNPLDCPARGKFHTEKDFLPIDPKENKAAGSSSWETLDKLKLD